MSILCRIIDRVKEQEEQDKDNKIHQDGYSGGMILFMPDDLQMNVFILLYGSLNLLIKADWPGNICSI